MSKGSGAGSVFGKIITFILVAVLILGIVGIAGYFLLREQGMTYYVEYNGQRYMGGMDGGSLILQRGTPNEFSVKSLTGEEVNYSVKVTANEANNFGFYVGEEFQRFYSEDDDEVNDYSQEFGLQKNADGFSLTMPEDYTVEQALEDKYGGEVNLRDELSDNMAYFVITVTVEKTSLNLWFVIGADVTGVTIDPPHIIFGGEGVVGDGNGQGNVDDGQTGGGDEAGGEIWDVPQGVVSGVVGVTDYSTYTSHFSYTGELYRVHIVLDYDTNVPVLTVNGIYSSAFMESGTAYEITFENNGGYFWEDNLGLVVADEYGYASETVDFSGGTVVYMPRFDVYSLQFQLVRYPITQSGHIDFYLTICEFTR